MPASSEALLKMPEIENHETRYYNPTPCVRPLSVQSDEIQFRYRTHPSNLIKVMDSTSRCMMKQQKNRGRKQSNEIDFLQLRKLADTVNQQNCTALLGFVLRQTENELAKISAIKLETQLALSFARNCVTLPFWLLTQPNKNTNEIKTVDFDILDYCHFLLWQLCNFTLKDWRRG